MSRQGSVTTLADLEALPVGARMTDAFGDVLTKSGPDTISQVDTADMPLAYVAKHWLPASLNPSEDES